MNYIEFIKTLNARQLSGMYLLFGEEIYLLEKAVEEVKRKQAGHDFGQFNLTVLEGKDLDFLKLYQGCETLPIGADQKVVIVKDMDWSPDGMKTNKDFFDRLLEYQKNLPEHLLLLLIVSSSKVAKSKLYKTLEKENKIVKTDKLNMTEIKSFIKKKLARSQVLVSSDQINHILSRIAYLDKSLGKTLYDVDNEVDKLIAYYLENQSLQPEEIDRVLINTYERNVFKLLDAVYAGNQKLTMIIFQDFQKEKADPFQIFYLLVRQVRLLIQVKEWRERGKSDAAIKQIMGISDFEYRKLAALSKKFSFSKLFTIFHLLYRTEVSLKSSVMDKNLNMELVMMQMTQPEAYI